jgi:hypothetical protein
MRNSEDALFRLLSFSFTVITDYHSVIIAVITDYRVVIKTIESENIWKNLIITIII